MTGKMMRIGHSKLLRPVVLPFLGCGLVQDKSIHTCSSCQCGRRHVLVYDGVRIGVVLALVPPNLPPFTQSTTQLSGLVEVC